MREVYGLVSGGYSDYQVHAIFESKETAEQAAADRNKTLAPYREPYQVEEFDLYAAGDPIPAPVTIYRVERFVNISGEASVEVLSTLDEWDNYYPPADKAEYLSDRRGREVVIALGTDREKLLHVVNDKVAQILAERHGVA